jgi:hypothetical protein
MARWLSPPYRSGLIAAMSSIALAAGALAGFAQPAVAASVNGSYRTIMPAAAIYIDSRDVKAQLGSGSADLPVGAWRDSAGKHHISRMLITFDISSFRNKKVDYANVFTAETSVNQCPNRAIDLWVADDVTSTTSWSTQPEVKSLVRSVSTPPYECPASYLAWGGLDALQSAVAAGKSRLTFEFRVPEAYEGDVAFGRRLVANVRMQVHFDTAPDVPSQLQSNGRGCVTQAPYPYLPGQGGFTLFAKLTDPDDNGGDWLDAHFAIWPVDKPGVRSEFVTSSLPSGNIARIQLPAGYLAEGVSYAWSVRADDGIFSSDWAASCYFTADLVSPSAPTVRSTDYPNDGSLHGGAGIPGTFTFGANGIPDVVSYTYQWYPYAPRSVPAPQMGGDATVSLTPPSGGPNILVVQSVDRAGNVSEQTSYQFLARWTAPNVSVVWPVPNASPGITLNPGPAMSGTFTFRPVMSDVVSYEYWLDSGGHHTVDAAADGSAQVAVTAGGLGSHALHARSVTRTGLVSGITDLNYYVDDAPFVSSSDYPEMDAGGGAGIPGTFTFAPKLAGVLGYVYSFDWGAQETVTAAPDGTATVQWTPAYGGFIALTVQAQYADGSYSQEYDYYFNVGPW